MKIHARALARSFLLRSLRSEKRSDYGIFMSEIIECIPNISEGRDMSVISACVNAVCSVDGIKMMNFSSDADHNRSVLTYMGNSNAVEEAAVRLAKVCAEKIDLRKHSGKHPRVGALDVLPFVPLRDFDTEQAVLLSRRVGKRIWEEVGIPVFLYEDSAKQDYRKNLADIRRGGFENLAQKTSLKEWQPDFGQGFHQSAGVTVAGARFPLIAYNFDLETDDVETAKKIAGKIRQSNGGLPGVKALGIYLKERNCAQVTVNLVNYTLTPLHVLTEEVRRLAIEYNTGVKQAELIGLLPMKAMAEAAAFYLGLADFDPDTRIIENYLL